jgi:hypothetical protein
LVFTFSSNEGKRTGALRSRWPESLGEDKLTFVALTVLRTAAGYLKGEMHSLSDFQTWHENAGLPGSVRKEMNTKK